jgi:hypothetical protein
VDRVALMSGLTARSSESAPTGLSATVASSSAATSTTAIAKGAVIAMATTKTKLVLAGVIALLLLASGGVVAFKALRPTSQPISTTIPATRSSAPFVVRFPQGSTYEILAITDAPDRRDRWWLPDGTPIPPFPGLLSAKPVPGHVLLVVTRRTDIAGLQNEVSWSLNLIGPRVLSSGVSFPQQHSTTRPGGSISVDEFRLSDNAPAIGDIKLELDWAPWTEHFDVDARQAMSKPTTGATSPQTAAFEFVQLLPGKTGRETYVVVRFSPEQLKRRAAIDEWLTATDAAGGVRSYMDMRRQTDGTFAYRVPMSRESIVAVHYGYRPRDVRKIRNVAFQPGVNVTPTVEPK